MTVRRIAVVTAGLTQPSSTRLLAERLAKATTRSLEERDIEGTVEFIELRDHALDLTNHLLTGFGSEGSRRAMKTVETADAVVAVTPIFSGSYNGLFKTFFDLLEQDSLRGTPVLVGATAGTARHSLALEHAIRPLFSYLGAVVVPTAVFGATEDWGSAKDDGTDVLSDRIERAGEELAAFIAAGMGGARSDPYEDLVSFSDMLDDGGVRKTGSVPNPHS